MEAKERNSTEREYLKWRGSREKETKEREQRAGRERSDVMPALFLQLETPTMEHQDMPNIKYTELLCVSLEPWFPALSPNVGLRGEGEGRK